MLLHTKPLFIINQPCT